MSAEGAALCYRTVCVEGSEILGRHAHPEVSMHTFPMSAYMRNVDTEGWADAAELLLASANKLVASGAEILISPDNTIHEALDLVRDRAPARWLHIAEEVGAVAAERGFKRLGILGTRYLMEGPVYRTKLAARSIASEIPGPEARERINSIIFDELVYGRFHQRDRDYLSGAIRDLAARGCDAVVLGCTEIPLIISDADSVLPTLPSTQILARAALREATRSA
ncbi:MAG TPA: amino acid racemase [Candidatus Polarisedimenticolaceae bacterium]|nr:amino acid racemase [Candidatus Polarisedimenticolaceae bacterium]